MKGGGQTFSSNSIFPVQQTMNGIGHRVNRFFGLATNTLRNKRRRDFPSQRSRANSSVNVYLTPTYDAACNLASSGASRGVSELHLSG